MIKAVWIATKRFYNEEFSYRVSALSYTTLFAIVPFLLTVASIISVFPISTQIIHTGNQFIFKNFVPESAIAVQDYFQTFTDQAAHLSIVSILFLIFSAWMMLYTIEDTFNDIWQAKKERNKIYSFLLNLSFLFTMPLAVGISVYVVRIIFSIPISMGLNHQILLSGIAFIIPILINTVIFSLFFIIIPNVKVRIKNGLIGGFIAAIALEITRRLFVYYILRYSTYSLIYGTFAIIPILIIWIYVFWFIIIFSALITHGLRKEDNPSL